MKAILDENKVDLVDIAALVGEARNAGVKLQAVVSDYKQMKACQLRERLLTLLHSANPS
ncbi:hypothetical protein [Candidatus Nitrososphaera gargensis]|nr:hypothetical protein [Candidatus Nitrososphaera gargensis]